MKLLKYNDYILEGLIQESKLVYSKRFISILSKMSNNDLANKLLGIYSTDIDVKNNFIDITDDDNNTVTFIPDRKAQELIGDKVQSWVVNSSDRYLTHSDKNKHVFSRLGYVPVSDKLWIPEVGSIGEILKETISNSISRKVYVLFKEIDGDKTVVLNKEALTEDDNNSDIVWNSLRNPIKIGRLIRSILTSAEIKFSEKDIEDFVNTYKATFDFSKNALLQFDVVKGEDIKYWYDGENYTSGNGTLNNSCMSGSESDYFNIYSDNSQIEMVILYDDGGNFDGDGNYKSKKIKGRALLWDLTIDGVPKKFLDRFYTTFDSDIELFKQYAISNNFWFKAEQSYDRDVKVTDGSITKSAHLLAKLTNVDFYYYPYVDTLSYIDLSNNTASNQDNYSDRDLKDTDGRWAQYDEDSDY